MLKKFLPAGIAATLAIVTMQGAIANGARPDAKPDDVRKAEESTKHIPAAKTGTLLNTDVTPEQGKRVAEETNRQVLHQQRHKAR